MRTMLRMTACISVVIFLTSGIVLGGSGRRSSGAQEKEKKISGWIGVMIRDINEKIARKAKLDSERGAYVNEVIEDSPADSAGILEGDIIIEFNEKNIFDSDDLVNVMHRTLPGANVSLIVVRKGEKKILHVSVGKKTESPHCIFGGMPPIPDVPIFSCNRILGLQLLTLNDQLGEYFGAPNNEGVLVEEVEHKSTAEKAGFKAGDIIFRIGNKTVDAVEKIRRELQKYNEGDTMKFEVMRKNIKTTLNMEMEELQHFQKNFFFPKPHMRMFRMDPFDDAEMQLEMDESQPEVDDVQREFERPTKDSKGWEHEIQKQVQRFTLSLPEQVKL